MSSRKPAAQPAGVGGLSVRDFKTHLLQQVGCLVAAGINDGDGDYTIAMAWTKTSLEAGASWSIS